VPPSHSLPNRPDVPVPGRYTTDRYGQVKTQDRRDPAPRESQESREPRASRESRDHRESRDTRDPRDTREFRTPDTSRTDRPARDFSGSDRRPDSTNRESGRHQERERDWPSRSDPPPRWNEHGPDSRPSRDRAPPAGGRGHDSRPAREPAAVATPPPPQTAPQTGPREPANNGADRPGQLTAEDRPNLINPERAALIGDNKAPGSRTTRDEPRDRGSSRNQSPRGIDRRTADPAPSDKARDDRHGRSHHLDQQHSSTRDGHGPPPHGQGRERMPNRDADRSSSAFQNAPSSRQHDADHTRLPHQDPNYGRLNAIPSAADNIPSGPRGRGGRDAGRTSSVNGATPRSDGRLPPTEPHRAPSPERHPPTGPASSRSTRRGRGGQFESSTTSPTTPVGSSSTPGVHPDRMAQIKPASAAPQPSQPAFNGPSAPGSNPIHPDRLGQIGGRPPPASASPAVSSSPRPNLPPLHTSDRQSVPSGSSAPQANLPSTPGNQPTPTGPSNPKERTRGRGERMMRGIQDTITGGSSSRRSGTRGRIDGSDAQVLVGGSPVTTPVHERPDPIRRDGGGSGADRPSANTEPLGPARDGRGTNGDDYQSTGTREHDRSGRREHRSSRSERPSRLNSRERSPERDRESKGHRDYRDRRSDVLPPPGSAGRDPDRDRPPPRRSGREANSANMEPIGVPSSREANREPLGSGRDPRNRGDGRGEGRGDSRGEGRGDGGGRGADEWSSGGGRGTRGGGGPRPNEDRRDGREDRGRKRRSEEGVGSMGSEREKRQRR